MFLCYVLPGEASVNPPDKGKLRHPPNKNEHELYDSVYNNGHIVIYTNSKSYPAYLIRYTLNN